jgi:CRISPR-associated endonuclease Csn1
MNSRGTPWRLGLDIGSSSVGWAALELDMAGDPKGILGLGTRIFSAGVDGDIETGKDESRSVARRGARMQRRQLDRRARRMRNVFNELRRCGLLPGAGHAESEEIHQALEVLDRELAESWITTGDHRAAQLLPYLLRAAAADRHLKPYEVGRALYHLAQRRGFASNRKESVKQTDEKELGPVKEGIKTLEALLAGQTLGQYFSTLDPHQHRIRSRWTSRQMYRNEFDRIRTSQEGGPAALDKDAWARIERATFHQRPLKSQKGKVGRCEFMIGERRAPKWLPEFQRFRMLSVVNNLRVRTPVDEGAALTPETRRGFSERALTSDERAEVLALLDASASVRLTSLRAKLKLKGTTFNLEEGGEKEIRGNVTGARLRGVFGQRWDAMGDGDRRRVITDVLSMEQDRALERRARETWGLEDDAVAAFVALRLEEGYATLSRLALSRLLPHLEAGLSVQEARQREFPVHFVAGDRAGSLPPVRKSLFHLRNPTVERSLTETRRIVNELIRAYGIPEQVHIELARDIKKSRKDRQDLAKANRNRQGERESAAERLRELGLANPSRADIERVLLHEECGGKCPYTGRSIALAELFSKSSPWDVEHIIPFSRSLDDSFANKTLCLAEENRNGKRNRTPFEAYSGDSDRYAQILSRVGQFQGKDARRKLDRFRVKDLGDDLRDEFCSRQLNDTRYASRLACGYLEELYGGASDEDGVRRIFASAGQVTAIVRRELGIEGLLGSPTDGRKNRDDHRHHGLDALAIALTSPGMVKRLADAAEGARSAGRRRFAALPAPWVTFADEAIARAAEMVVSHRGSRTIGGELHNAANYSRPIGGDPKVRHVRKPVSWFVLRGDVEDIVDSAVRQAVKAHIAARGGDKRCLANDRDPPRLPAKDGTLGNPIRRVRIRVSNSVVPVGVGARQRFVAPDSNHHMAIVSLLGPDGNPVKWEGHVVTRLEAARRAARGEPVIQRDWGAGRRFCFSLASGDMVRLTVGEHEELFVVRGVSAAQVEFTRATEARPVSVIRRDRLKRFLFSPSTLIAKARCARLDVSAGGAIRNCND